ncbi:MAG: hypothetical protein JSS53_09330 [Proteobacteria bacterium]|nr:hypothetical protein [Pseudomonadota bacterium]
MVGKVFTILVVLIAVVMAFLGVVLPLDRLHDYMFFMRFFESMIPVLAVGALIKYLCTCRHCEHKD